MLLNQHVNAALADTTFKAKLAELGREPYASAPAEFGKFIADSTQKWGKIIAPLASRPNKVIVACAHRDRRGGIELSPFNVLSKLKTGRSDVRCHNVCVGSFASIWRSVSYVWSAPHCRHVGASSANPLGPAAQLLAPSAASPRGRYKGALCNQGPLLTGSR